MIATYSHILSKFKSPSFQLHTRKECIHYFQLSLSLDSALKTQQKNI